MKLYSLNLININPTKNTLKQNIFSHRWFDGFNWEGLRNQSLEPPITPTVRNVVDTSNFDVYPPDPEGPPPDDITGWDSNF